MSGRPRFRRLFSFEILRSDPQSEVSDELEFHFEETIRSLVATGMPHSEATEEAHRRFGNRARYQRELERLSRSRVSAQRLSEWRSGIAQDIRYTLRSLRRSRAFTLGIVGTLAVAIGATTLMVALVNGVLLRPLPFPDADRVVRVFDTRVERGQLSSTSSPANFLDWREHQTTFDALAAYVSSRTALTDVAPAEDLPGFQVSAEWFDVLGVHPMLGRTFRRDEEISGNDRVAIVSAAFWQRFLGADSSAVGRTISLEGTPHEVVGVMPPGFAFPTDDAAIWRPLSFDFDVSTSRGVHYLYVIGRVRSNQTIDTAEGDLQRVMRGLRASFPEPLEGWDVRVGSMQQWLVGNTGTRLVIFLGAVALLLLVAAVNVSNLMMVRALSRAHELAVRAAIGAGRGRLVRQLVIEALALSLTAAALGLVLAGIGLDGVRAIASNNIPRLSEVSLDATVIAVVAGVAVVLGIVLGSLPAIAVLHRRIETALKAGGRHRTSNSVQNRMRSAFVVVQVAMATLLAIGAGLLVRSFEAMKEVDPGYAVERAWTATISLPGERYPDDNQRSRFFLDLVDRVATLPGVQSAAVTTQLPLEYYGINFSFWRDGDDLRLSERPSGDFRVVTSDYFATMGIPVLRGRAFLRSDGPDGEPVIVINDALAERFFPGEDPVGQLMHVSYGDEDTPHRIVGVVGAVRQRTLDTPAVPGYYLPLGQVAWSSMRVVLRTAAAALALTNAVRQEVAAMDPLVPVRDVRTLEERFSRVVGTPRFNAFVFFTVAAIAGLVALAGVYSVTSYAVAQRTHEIGVRMALGAPASRVRRSVAMGVIKLGATGAALGCAVGIVATRLIAGLLFDVSATDSTTFVLVGLVFLVVALLGGYVPARRASGVDPLIALHAE